MPTRVIISLLTLIFVIGALGVSTATAQKYTTRSSRVLVSSSSDSKSEKCTVEDVRAIKKFDRKAKAAIRKATLSDYKDEKTSRKDIGKAKRAAKEAQKAARFLESDEYEQMKIVYKRCGKEIPRVKQDAPFWVPKHLRSADATCSSCAKK